MPPLCESVRVRCQTENWPIVQVERILSRPFSSAKPRGSHRSNRRFFRTERPFALAALNLPGGKQSALGQNRYRRLAARWHARTSQLTGQQETENVRALTDTKHKRPKRLTIASVGVERKVRPRSSRGQIHHSSLDAAMRHRILEISGSRTAWKPRDNRRCHSEPCGFLFLSLFRSGCWKRIAGPQGMLQSLLGGIALFSLFLDFFCFAFVLSCAGAVPVHYKPVRSHQGKYRTGTVQTI